MAEFLNFYELILINKYDSSINENYAIVNSLRSYLEKNSIGTIKRKEFWGLLNFTYPIQKYRKGHYIFFALALKNRSSILAVKKYLKKIESLVRVVVFKTKEISEEFSPLAKISETKTRPNFSANNNTETIKK